MVLYFLRHGLAGQHGDPAYKDDSLRPLTAKGREKINGAALGMKALGLKFDCLLSSPYLRAKQTAEIVARVFRVKDQKIHFTRHLLPPASIHEVLKEIHTHFPKSKNILLVGHQPHLTEMMSCLLKSEKPLEIDFKKGGLCCMGLAKPLGRRSAVLHWLLTPAQLTRLNLLNPVL